ncbi:MAG: flagellar hook-basal body complex protein FliE [Lawsonibacter sp.]|nr:flagellar hook-basal body complex protein FliE [Lawsonibacter sp.]
MSSIIERIGQASQLRQLEELAKEQPGQSDGLSAFASIFQSAIQNVKDTNQDMVQSQYLLSTGQLDNPASLMIAMTKYSAATDLLVQLRNRALDAYSEITRMSI